MVGFSSVGLVLRSQAVEVVELSRTLRGVAVTKHVRVPVAGAEDADVVAAIRSALTAAGVQATRRLGVTVPAQDAFLRSFTLPLLPEGERSTAVQFEARKYIPFKTDALVWDFHVSEPRGAKQLEAVFVGIRKETFAQIHGWLKEAGVRAAFLEAPWFSLARLVRSLRKPSDETFYGIVDLEPHAAHIVFAKDQVPYLGRVVNLTPPSEGPEAAKPPVDPRAERLLSELRLSLDFFTGERHRGSLNRLWLFGDAATVGPWREWLATQLSCQMEMGTLPLHLTRGEVVDPGFAVGVGAALRELRPRFSAAKLNFLERGPERAAAGATLKISPSASLSAVWSQIRSAKSLAKPAALQASLAVACLAVLATVSHRQVATARQQTAQALRAFQDVGGGLSEKQAPELDALQQQVNTRLAFLRRIVQQRVSVTEKLDVLAKALPEGIWLEGLDYEDPLEGLGPSHASLALRGGCILPQSENELEAIREFTQRLKQDTRFFQGFATAQLGEIARTEAQAQQSAYRVFRLDYLSEQQVF